MVEEKVGIKNINNMLKKKLLNLLPAQGMKETDMGGMKIYRHEVANKVERCFYAPVIVVILQGRKHSIVGSEKITYTENECLVTGVDLPISSYLTDVSHDHPLLSITLPIDRFLISQLSYENLPINAEDASFKAMSVAVMDENVLGAFLRLVDLIDSPNEAKVLAPMIISEIHYRLLLSPLGQRLRTISAQGSRSHQIAEAIDWLKHNYTEPLKIDALAGRVNMASSTFRRHFKFVTTLTPLQYQKRLRLYDARRLMLIGSHNATSACYAVGYESPSQFNREYKKMFGDPPYKDVLREITTQAVAS